MLRKMTNRTVGVRGMKELERTANMIFWFSQDFRYVIPCQACKVWTVSDHTILFLHILEHSQFTAGHGKALLAKATYDLDGCDAHNNCSGWYYSNWLIWLDFDSVSHNFSKLTYKECGKLKNKRSRLGRIAGLMANIAFSSLTTSSDFQQILSIIISPHSGAGLAARNKQADRISYGLSQDDWLWSSSLLADSGRNGCQCLRFWAFNLLYYESIKTTHEQRFFLRWRNLNERGTPL